MKTKISSSWKYFGVEDEIGLLSQIYDGFTCKTKEIEIARITSDEDQKIVDNNEFLCGIKDLTTLSLFREYKVLQFNKSLDSSNKEKNNTLKIYKAKINWNNLPQLTAYLHDKEAIEPYGERKQQEILYRLILKESIKQKESKFLLNEEILGEYAAYSEDFRQYNHEKSPVRHVKFLSTILMLKDLNILDIIQSNFHFDAQPRTVRTQTKLTISFITNPYKICRPSAHCLLLIELIKIKNKVEKFSGDDKTTNEYQSKEIEFSNEKQISEKNLDKLTEIVITNDWKLIEEGKLSFITFKDDNKFIFKGNGSIEYRYFKYLCVHYGKYIDYKDIYEFGSRVSYPEKGKRAATNSSITNSLKKTLKKLHAVSLFQINIEVNRGYTLTIKD